MDKVFPQISALEDEKRAAYVNPEVHVHLIVRDVAQDQRTVKTEPVQIEGVTKAYYTPDKTLSVALGASANGQPVWAQIQGDRKQAETVARLFGRSGSKGAVASR